MELYETKLFAKYYNLKIEIARNDDDQKLYFCLFDENNGNRVFLKHIRKKETERLERIIRYLVEKINKMKELDTDAKAIEAQLAEIVWEKFRLDYLNK